MTITHVYTYTVTDRSTGQDAPLAIGIENGRAVTQGPKSWEADEPTLTAVCAGMLRAAELLQREQRESVS